MKKIPRTVAELNGQEIDINDNSYQVAMTTDNVIRQVIGCNELTAAILTDPNFKAVIVESFNVGDTLTE